MKLNPLRFLAGPLSNHRNTRVFFEVFVLSCLAVLAVKPSFAGEETNSIEAGAFRVDSLPFLEVGNLLSEHAHAYHTEGDLQRVNGNWWYDGEFNNILFKTPATADDGVSFTNSSTFTVAISPDNQGVRLRRRCDKANNRQEARVFIDGQLVTERPWYSVDYEKTYRNIRWLDSDFEVPPRYTKGKSKIKVRIEFVSSETGRWDEYHYWVYSNSSPKRKFTAGFRQSRDVR